MLTLHKTYSRVGHVVPEATLWETRPRRAYSDVRGELFKGSTNNEEPAEVEITQGGATVGLTKGTRYD